MSDGGGILAVLRATTSDFISPQQGQPSNNSHSIMILGGIDYQAKGLWRYRLLAGVEVRTFQASQYSTHFAPIAEGGAIWTPTELVTVTSTLSRAVEDPEIGGSNGFVSNRARLIADYEYRRNIFLQSRGSIQYAQYLQSGGGTQTGLTAGAGATWLLNRNLRLSLDYDFTRVTGSSNSVSQLNPDTTLATAPYTQSVIALTLHFAL
jgi:opacity protein-like surface antigen